MDLLVQEAFGERGSETLTVKKSINAFGFKSQKIKNGLTDFQNADGDG